MKRSILTFLTLALSVIAFAQEQEVKGTVTNSANGLALPGVNVILKGTTNGTTTDAEGKFRLITPPSGVLIFSFIGMATQEVEIGGKTDFTVGLEEDSKQLSEV